MAVSTFERDDRPGPVDTDLRVIEIRAELG